MDTEPPASNDSTPPEGTPDEPVPAVPTKETTPIWAQTNPAAPAHKKGDPDWSKTTEQSTNGGDGRPSPAWAATVPSSPGEPAEVHEPAAEAESDGKSSTEAVSEPPAPSPLTEPPAASPLTDPPKAVAADAMRSTWPPAATSSPAPPEETDIWPPEPPTERAMPAWPPSSEMEIDEEAGPQTPAQPIPSWPESFDSAQTAPTTPPATVQPSPAAEIAAPATASNPRVPTLPVRPAAETAPAAAPVQTTPAAPVAPAAVVPPAPAVTSTPAQAPAPAPEPAPVVPSQSGPPSRPAWAPAPAAAEPAASVGRPPSAQQLQVPAWAPRVPLASQPGTPTWFSPKEEIPHATAQPMAQPVPTPEAEPAPPVVGGQLPVAQIPAAAQPASQPPAARVTTWEVVQQSPKSGPHAPAQAGPTAEDRSYAEWFAWAKRGGAPATACHAAAQGAFKALSSGKDVSTAVQWATAAMSQPPAQVAFARQQYCAWFALANIDLNLDQHRAHLFSAAAIQALDAGQDASAAHAAGLAAAGIR